MDQSIPVRPVGLAGLTQTSAAGRQFVARRALAAVTAWYVDAVGITLAQVVSTVTLIDVYDGGSKREISQMVCTVSVWSEEMKPVHSRTEHTVLLWLWHSSDGRSWIMEGPDSCSRSEPLYKDGSCGKRQH